LRRVRFHTPGEISMRQYVFRVVATVTVWSVMGASAGAQSSLPRAPGARVVTVTPAGAVGFEPTIAVNPGSPNQVTAAWGPGGWAAYSADSGRTFTTVNTAPAGGPSGGDDALTYGDNASLYLAFGMAQMDGSTPNYWGRNARGSGVWLRRSPDGGKTWDSAAMPIKVWPDGQPAPEREDMQRIWADNQPKSPYRGNLYMAWIGWSIDKSIVLFTRSTDHGKTWAVPRRISTHAGHPRDDNGDIVGILGTVGPDGTQYIVWDDGVQIVLATSHDGGQTFAPSHPILDVDPPYFGGWEGIAGVLHVMGFPQIGVDSKTGALYVCWSDTRNGDVDVFLSRSTDHGVTWSPAVRVNDDPIHDGVDQFFQWLAVDPTDGALYVQFYDRRGDPGGQKTWVTLARSTDGGHSFKNYAWTDTPFTGENAFLGDYMWLTAYGGRAYGVWAESVAASDTSGFTRPEGIPPGSPTIIRVGVADFNGTR